MNYLFVDTETTGLFNYKRPLTHPDQGRLVQLGYILHTSDATLDSAELLIAPSNFTIPEAMTRIHGISHAKAVTEGVPIAHALNLLEEAASQANVLIAHNLRFDYSILLGEYARQGIPIPAISHLSPFCTMTALRDRMKLRGNHLGFKNPRLSEAYEWAFKKPNTGAHTALADAQACCDLYWHCRSLGYFPVPPETNRP